ncbi:MAG: hypothetical protein Ta2A_14420 [Treponemataceae bacterium]|nr:MAG: hypothetical protein Ta2A_14420 [Treponemataceae bacterium]
MTKKRKVIVCVVAGVVVCWAGLGSLARVNRADAMRFYGAWDRGARNSGAAVAVKDFEPVELVFVSTTAKKGDAVDVKNLLLKEAQKLGGHGVINVNIVPQKKSGSKEVTWTGSALAVKYTDSLGVSAPSDDSLPPMRDGFGRIRN